MTQNHEGLDECRRVFDEYYKEWNPSHSEIFWPVFCLGWKSCWQHFRTPPATPTLRPHEEAVFEASLKTPFFCADAKNPIKTTAKIINGESI